MPILIWWGMPISITAPIGNLLFNPVITIFLFLATIIFFCELLHIPHMALNSIFEYINTMFISGVALGSKKWLIAVSMLPIPYLLAIPCSATLLLCHKKLQSPFRMVLAQVLLSLSIYCFVFFVRYDRPVLSEIPCNHGKLMLVQSAGKTALIDPGCIGQSVAAPSWMEYTCIPSLIKDYGILTIDYLVIMQPSQMTYEGLAVLIDLCIIKKIYEPVIHGSMSENQEDAYRRFLEKARHNGTCIEHVEGTAELIFGIDRLMLLQEGQRMSSKKMAYHALTMAGTINAIPIQCRAYKMRAKKLERET